MRAELKQLVVNVRVEQPDVYVGRRSGRWEGSTPSRCTSERRAKGWCCAVRAGLERSPS